MTEQQKQRVTEIENILPLLDEAFHGMMEKLLSSKSLNREELPSFSGIYVFFKDDNPIYVGRANNIKNRIHGHTRKSSGHNSANFAFNLAKLELSGKLQESKLGREKLMEDSEFLEKFRAIKEDLFASKIKCLEVKNDVLQTMFEPYLAVKLKTYPINNTFENH
jgi:predicted GIY-YIG superfamily endonuclease